MRRGILIAWALLGVVIVGMVVAWGRTHDASSLNPPMLTQQLKPVKLRGPAPDFTGTTLTGDDPLERVAGRQARGDRLLLDLVCPCKQEASGSGHRCADDYRGRVRLHRRRPRRHLAGRTRHAFATKHGWRLPDHLGSRRQASRPVPCRGQAQHGDHRPHGRLVLLVPGPHMLSEYRAAIDKVLAE